jgi:hypothetical protein
MNAEARQRAPAAGLVGRKVTAFNLGNNKVGVNPSLGAAVPATRERERPQMLIRRRE